MSVETPRDPNEVILPKSIGHELLKPVPAARVRHSDNQTIPTGVLTVLSFDTEDFDTVSLHVSTNNSRLTAPVAGIYSIGAAVQWAGNAIGRRMIVLRLNGITSIAVNRVEPVAEAGVTTDQNIVTPYVLAAGDYVEVTARQDSGDDLDSRASVPFSPFFYMTYWGSFS